MLHFQGILVSAIENELNAKNDVTIAVLSNDFIIYSPNIYKNDQ